MLESRSLGTGIAVLALIVAAAALASTARDRDHDGASPRVTSVTTTTAAPQTVTTPTTVASGRVTVPNVSRPPLSRKDAEAILNEAHLEVSIESLPLANIPAGFVISQNPLPEALANAGSTVTLVISSVA